MSITKLIADMDMDLDIVHLSEDESTEKTGVKSKNETVVINCEQNTTETNNGKREVHVQNEKEVEINWDLLEMESDNEEVKTQKESQGSDNSVLLLEAGSGSLVLSSREDDLDMNENDSLDLDMGEKGDDNLKGISQNNVVSTNESRVCSGNMMVELTLDGEDNEFKIENREGLNDNVDMDINASENLVLSFGVDGDNFKRVSDNGAISDDNKDMFPEKKVGFVLVSADNKEIGNENMQVLDKNGDLNLDKTQRVGLDSGRGNNSDVVMESISVTDMEKTGESEKMELQLVLVSGDVETEIKYIEGLTENSASGTCANNNLCSGPGDADNNLKGSIGSSVISSIKSKDNSKKMDLGTFLAEKDEKMENENIEGVVSSIESKKLILEDVIANSSAVRGDSERNSLELVLYTRVHGTIVDTSKEAETNKEQTEKIEPSMDSANSDFSLNSAPSNKIDQTKSNSELETADLGSTLGSFLDSKSPKRRGRKPKGKTNVADTNLESVVCHTGEGSSSRGKRERKGSKYLSHPFTSIKYSPKSLKRDKITNGEDKEVNNGESKKMKTGDDVKEVYKGDDGKSEMFSENVVLDLISTAQGPLNPQNSILTKPTTGLLTAFRNSISGNVKTSQEVCPMTCGPTANVLNSGSGELHQGYIHDEPAALLVKFHSSANIPSKEDLIATFTKFGALIEPETHLITDGESARVVFARKKDGQVAFESINRSGEFETARLRFVSPIKVEIAPPPVLLDARDKLEEMIMSFNGSGLENKETFIGDIRGLLEKVNLILTKNGFL